MKKRALISVFYKDGVLELAQYLVSKGWEILSTGGTKKHLAEAGLPVTDVSAVTGFPECLDGRVKTLHPKIHAGLLAIRKDEEHMKTMRDLSVDPIDLVCVNLYPFFEKVQAGLSFDETVEFIDIGGPTMLRSAARTTPTCSCSLRPRTTRRFANPSTRRDRTCRRFPWTLREGSRERYLT
jgi:phosphoribosylaminoimidazolecarboxamide formyltransferase/IMP cyclohydrolase